MQLTMSIDVATYKLPKSLRERFSRFDKLIEYAKAAGKEVPHVRLAKPDFITLDGVIREQSNGLHNAASAVYRGYRIISA